MSDIQLAVDAQDCDLSQTKLVVQQYFKYESVFEFLFPSIEARSSKSEV